MSNNLIEKAYKELEENINSNDLNCFQENLVEQLRKYEADGVGYVKQLFELFEKHPSVYWGEPGAIVHYLESLDRGLYEKELIASIERCPVDHTIWMLNRVCNSKKTKEEINKYCDIFKKVIQKKFLNDNVINSAESFLNYQNKRLAQIDNAHNIDSHSTNKNALNDIFGFLNSINIKPKK